MNREKLDVWLTMEAMNSAWTDGRVDELASYCHDEIVAIVPNERRRIEGKADYLAAWERFSRRATIHEWSVSEPKVLILGETALVCYDSELMCVIDGEVVWLPGRQMHVLLKEGGRWLVIACQFSEFPSRALTEILAGPQDAPRRAGAGE